MDKVTPWPNKTDDYVLALTGSAFIQLYELDALNPNTIYKTVLDRAQVYARMSPEDKGFLVGQL